MFNKMLDECPLSLEIWTLENMGGTYRLMNSSTELRCESSGANRAFASGWELCGFCAAAKDIQRCGAICIIQRENFVFF